MSISVCRTFPDEAKGADPIPKPVIKFEHAFSEFPDLLEEIRKQGFEKPSPIQAQVRSPFNSEFQLYLKSM